MLTRFRILEDGFIGDVIILESLHTDCDTEAIRVIKKLPHFTPRAVDAPPDFGLIFPFVLFYHVKQPLQPFNPIQ